MCLIPSNYRAAPAPGRVGNGCHFPSAQATFQEPCAIMIASACSFHFFPDWVCNRQGNVLVIHLQNVHNPYIILNGSLLYIRRMQAEGMATRNKLLTPFSGPALLRHLRSFFRRALYRDNGKENGNYRIIWIYHIGFRVLGGQLQTERSASILAGYTRSNTQPADSNLYRTSLIRGAVKGTSS